MLLFRPSQTGISSGAPSRGTIGDGRPATSSRIKASGNGKAADVPPTIRVAVAPVVAATVATIRSPLDSTTQDRLQAQTNSAEGGSDEDEQQPHGSMLLPPLETASDTHMADADSDLEEVEVQGAGEEEAEADANAATFVPDRVNEDEQAERDAAGGVKDQDPREVESRRLECNRWCWCGRRI